MKLPNQSSNAHRSNGVAEAFHQGISPSQFPAYPLYTVFADPLYILANLNSCLVSYTGKTSWKFHASSCLKAAGFSGDLD